MPRDGDLGVFADLDEKARHVFFVMSVRLKFADAADQERRSVRFLVAEIRIPRVTDADQKLPPAGLFFSYGPGRRSSPFQNLVPAVGCEDGDGRTDSNSIPVMVSAA